jgi:phosphatidylglycerophosphate synthase
MPVQHCAAESQPLLWGGKIVQAVILAHRRLKGTLLALRPVCGVPLIRRQLQVLRNYDWRQAVLIVHPQDRGRIEAAVGDPAALGVQVSYLTSPREAGLPLKACLEKTDGDLLILEAHYVIEGILLEKLSARGTTALLREGAPVGVWWREGYAGAVYLTRADLERLATETDVLSWPAGLMRLPAVECADVGQPDLYVAEVRRQVEPFWCEVRSEADARQCKRALVLGAQKRTLDVLAWYFNRPLENWLTLHLADWPITPNQMSVVTSLLAFAVSGLFLLGWPWPAALLAFLVNVLDGVDGKLARVKALATRLGQLEHSFDLLYEQSWYIAYTWVAYRSKQSLAVLAVGFAMLLCDSFARHVSMQFRQVMGLSLADYAPFDRRFRRFDGRRNIYSIYMLLGVVVGHPFYGLIAMALHAAITGLVYVVRAGLHLRRADRGIVGRQP